MRRSAVCALALAAVMLCACARLEFDDAKGLTYYDGQPYLFIVADKDCNITAKPLMLPGEKRHVAFKSGLGSADLSVTLENGMIAKVGQNTDTKLSDTLTSLPGVTTALTAALALTKAAPAGEIPGVAKEKVQLVCPQAVLIPVSDTGPDFSRPLRVPLEAVAKKEEQEAPSRQPSTR